MGLNPIEYHPWVGPRAPHNLRLLVIAKNIVHQKIRSGYVLSILGLGTLIVFLVTWVVLLLFSDSGLAYEAVTGSLSSAMFTLFTLLLAAVVSADLISEDLRSSSFVLYFSRPITAKDYLAGKMLGAMVIMGIYCVLFPLITAILAISADTGISGGDAVKLILQTLAGGMLAAFVFLPFCMLLSSLTKRSAYTTIGAFMSFFALTIIAEMFVSINPNWELISPIMLMYNAQSWIFGLELSNHTDPSAVGGMLLLITVIPLALAYWRIWMKEAGK